MEDRINQGHHEARKYLQKALNKVTCRHHDVEQEWNGPEDYNPIYCIDCGEDVSFLYERDWDSEAKELEMEREDDVL